MDDAELTKFNYMKEFYLGIYRRELRGIFIALIGKNTSEHNYEAKMDKAIRATRVLMEQYAKEGGTESLVSQYALEAWGGVEMLERVIKSVHTIEGAVNE